MFGVFLRCRAGVAGCVKCAFLGASGGGYMLVRWVWVWFDVTCFGGWGVGLSFMLVWREFGCGGFGVIVACNCLLIFGCFIMDGWWR